MSQAGPELQVDDEPEDERPFGAGQDPEPALDGLAVDPYADDVLVSPLRSGSFLWRWIAVIAALVVIAILLIIVIALRARGG
jgi:hypothetical protein